MMMMMMMKLYAVHCIVDNMEMSELRLEVHRKPFANNTHTGCRCVLAQHQCKNVCQGYCTALAQTQLFWQIGITMKLCRNIHSPDKQVTICCCHCEVEVWGVWSCQLLDAFWLDWPRSSLDNIKLWSSAAATKNVLRFFLQHFQFTITLWP